VAIVGSESPSRIKVDYQELPDVHDPLEAINSDAAVGHESLRSYLDLHVRLADIPNIHSYAAFQTGHHERGIYRSDSKRPLLNRGSARVNYFEPRAVVVQMKS
jgi:hypothetical protein